MGGGIEVSTLALENSSIDGTYMASSILLSELLGLFFILPSLVAGGGRGWGVIPCDFPRVTGESVAEQGLDPWSPKTEFSPLISGHPFPSIECMGH